MRKLVAISFLLCLHALQGLHAQKLQIDTLLRSYLDRLYNKYSLLQIEDSRDHLQELSSELEVQQLITEPRLSLSYVPWRVGIPPLQLSLSQQFPWPGQRNRLQKQQQEKVKYSSLQLQQSYEAAALSLLQDLYKLYEIDQVLKWEEKKANLLLQREQLSEARLRSNGVDVLDLLEIQSEIEQLKERLTTLSDQSQLLRKSIALQLHLPSQSIHSPDTLLLPNLRRDSLSFSQNTGLIAKRQAEVASAAVLQYQRYSRWPKLQLQLSYLVREKRALYQLQLPSSLKGGVVVGISLRLPILGKRHSLRDKISNSRLKLQKLQTIVYTEMLELQVEASWQKYKEGLRKWKKYNRLQVLTEEASDLLLARYKSDEEKLDRYLQAKIKLLTYRIHQAAALQLCCSAAATLFYIQSSNF